MNKKDKTMLMIATIIYTLSLLIIVWYFGANMFTSPSSNAYVSFIIIIAVTSSLAFISLLIIMDMMRKKDELTGSYNWFMVFHTIMNIILLLTVFYSPIKQKINDLHKDAFIGLLSVLSVGVIGLTGGMIDFISKLKEN